MPVFGVLHAEASAVVAGVGFIVSGLGALVAFRDGASFSSVARTFVTLLAVPWAMLTLSLLWRANAGYLLGLALFATFAVPSVLLAVAAAYALHHSRVRWKRTVFVLGSLSLLFGSLVYDLGLHPQVYTYNPVFGGVLGPIYDEELAVRPGLFWAKGLTLILAAWLACLGEWLLCRMQGGNTRRYVLTGGGLSLALAAGPLLAPRLGIVTTYEALERSLGGHLATNHVDLFYDPTSLDAEEAWQLGQLHEFRYAQLREALGVEPQQRIQSFVYPDAGTKARLTGARTTSVAPVWLSTPQVHLLENRIPSSLAHELAHAFSREFGGILNASWSIGLVEGLAVAVEPPDGAPDPTAQVAAALHVAADDEGVGLGSGAEDLAAALVRTQSLTGFWGGRAAVSYTTMGAFVGWLLDSYGAAPVRAAYPSLDYASAFGVPLDTLALRWAQYIEAQPRDTLAEAVVAYRFVQPSLFERASPHHVPRPIRLTRAAHDALYPTRHTVEPDTATARKRLAEALAEEPHYPAALWLWSAMQIAEGRAATVVTAIEKALAADTLVAQSPQLAIRLGDAYAVLGDSTQARLTYTRAATLLSPFADLSRAVLALKQEAAPEALRWFVHPYAHAESAAALEALDEPAMAAIQWALADDFDRAASAMRSYEPDDPLLARARLVWLSTYTMRARRYTEATRLAAQTEAAFSADGQRWHARFWADRVELNRWLSTGKPSSPRTR
ncbi:MAG: hypothetical protein AAF624_06600 [Bacteroidota bacterium]